MFRIEEFVRFNGTGDWEKFNEIIASTFWTPADLENRHDEDEEGENDTLLIIAARKGKEDVVHLLLNFGADIEAKAKVA